MESEFFLRELIHTLPECWKLHAPTTKLHQLLKATARREVERMFSSEKANQVPFGSFGDLVFPYHAMGAVDSTHLFDLDALILFSFYWTNRHRYERVLDVGANLGLHSLVMSRCGCMVRSFEPDPGHFRVLKRNIENNDCPNVTCENAALSSRDGEMEFVRVLGNTTSSHLAGSKENPYGEIERFPVKIRDARPLFAWADLIKLDVEGHEKEILKNTTREDWLDTDALVEVQDAGNARTLYEHFQEQGVNLFAQKINWRLVRALEEMPTSYKEGTLFISRKDRVPW